MFYYVVTPSPSNLWRTDGRKLQGVVFEDPMLIPVCLNYMRFNRHAWTGGDTPPKPFQHTTQSASFKSLRRLMFRELLAICGGLDLWQHAGTSALDRTRIFWNQASLDAWRTLQSAGIPTINEGENNATT